MTNWQEWLYSSDVRRNFTSIDSTFAPRSASEPAGSLPTWRDLDLQTAGGRVRAKLFVPSLPVSRAPLLLLLHGCNQTSDEFAIATSIARHAETAGYVVLVAEQCASRHAARCWNWFDASHQSRGEGEPAMLVDAVRQVSGDIADIDRGRVYVAGLSAGGSMAVILGHTYPDVFAAVGCHSGLPYGRAESASS
ncbi:MAG: PHB depolymerase family esterase, partial [Pseudomonadota bacterium]|nr:PHB depolymerase family esterase [Pseudomonadota bacterium]